MFVVGGAVEGEQYGTATVETFRGGDDTWRSHEPLPFGPLLGAAAVSIGSDPVPTLVGGSKRQKGLIQVKPELRFAFFISEKWRNSIYSSTAFRRRVGAVGSWAEKWGFLPGGSDLAAPVGVLPVRDLSELFIEDYFCNKPMECPFTHSKVLLFNRVIKMLVSEVWR